MTKDGRIRYIDQSHGLLSLFRQTELDPDWQMETLKEMAEIIESRFSHDQMSGEELRAATTLRQMLAHHLGKSVPPSAWALGHLAIDWGQLELSSDLKAQFDRAKAAPAIAGRRKVGDPIRDAARQDIKMNPQTPQGACARRVAKALGRDDAPNIERRIKDLFEWSQVGGGRRQKRPRPTVE